MHAWLESAAFPSRVWGYKVLLNCSSFLCLRHARYAISLKWKDDPVMSIPIPPPRLPIFLRTGDKSQYACLCARLIRSPKAMNPDMMLRVPQPIDIPWSMEFSRRSIA
jgi:hypothetical protein